jgi:hypothetical protein
VQRLETNLSGGPGIRVFGALLALVVSASACGGDEDCSVTDSCPNQAPAVTITSPTDGADVVVGEMVTFTGSATDPEDGALTGSALVWTSDLDGAIGTGTTFNRDDLSGGVHEITLTATDADGESGSASISVRVGSAPLVTIVSPTNQASGAPLTVLTGTEVGFLGSATDEEDGAIPASALVWRSNVDGEIGTGSSFSSDGLTPGMHTVTLTATDSDGNEGKRIVLVIVKPPAAPEYQIHIRWSEGVELTEAQRTAVVDAVAKLENVITGDVTDLPISDFGTIGNCGGASVPHLQESVDDVIIYLEFVPIDGPDGTVGSAGPCLTRSGTALSLVGGMRFDTDDLEALEALGLMDDIILHEMMHVLGFGIFWDGSCGGSLPFDYLEEPSDPSNCDYDETMTDTHFTGANAITQFNAIGGTNYTGGAIVPVENDNQPPEPIFQTGSLDGHWRESVFDEEIMTPAANCDVVTPPCGDLANPLSVVTIGSFEDLGYTVDYGAADTYDQTFSFTLDAQGETPQSDVPRIDLSGDVWRGPIQAIDPDGKRHRIR